jgi:hypothetical protein
MELAHMTMSTAFTFKRPIAKEMLRERTLNISHIINETRYCLKKSWLQTYTQNE